MSSCSLFVRLAVALLLLQAAAASAGAPGAALSSLVTASQDTNAIPANSDVKQGSAPVDPNANSASTSTTTSASDPTATAISTPTPATSQPIADIVKDMIADYGNRAKTGQIDANEKLDIVSNANTLNKHGKSSKKHHENIEQRIKRTNEQQQKAEQEDDKKVVTERAHKVKEAKSKKVIKAQNEKLRKLHRRQDTEQDSKMNSEDDQKRKARVAHVQLERKGKKLVKEHVEKHHQAVVEARRELQLKKKTEHAHKTQEEKKHKNDLETTQKQGERDRKSVEERADKDSQNERNRKAQRAQAEDKKKREWQAQENNAKQERARKEGDTKNRERQGKEQITKKHIEAAAKSSELKEKQSEGAQKQKVERQQKQSAEQQQKAFNFGGMCTIAPGCAAGWSDHGYVGIITRNQDFNGTPFTHGARFNPWWMWAHPRLCCADNAAVDIENQYMLGARDCPPGTPSFGFGGVILTKAEYSKNPFDQGAGFNGEWNWAHPHLCRIGSKSQLRKGVAACMFARGCPNGWQDHGWAGIISNNNDKGRQPFNIGAPFNSGWTWIHPRLCCA